MMNRLVKTGAVLAVVALFATSAWAQQRAGGRGGGFMGFGGANDEYVSAVLLLDEATAAKVKAVYEQENSKYREAMQALRESAGDDREAMRAKMQEEREKSAERIAAALQKGILSEGQVRDIKPILASRSSRQDAYLWALGSLKLSSDQRTRMLGVTVPFAVKMASRSGGMGRQRGGDQSADRSQRQEEMRKWTEEFRTAAGAILTADQKGQWEKKATELQAQWEKEREERRQQRGTGGQGGAGRRSQQ